jgi:hypothetical protein
MITTTIVHERPFREKYFATLLSGSFAEGLGGLATGVLAIIGFSGILPITMLSIASMVIGVAFLLEGGMVITRSTEEGKTKSSADISAGVTAETIGGIAAIALGVLSFIGINPVTLIPISVLISGEALILATAVHLRSTNTMVRYSERNDVAKEVSRQMMTATSDIQFLIGIGTVVVGILALLNIVPLTLSLIGMLMLGVSDLLNGVAQSGRMISVFSR